MRNIRATTEKFSETREREGSNNGTDFNAESLAGADVPDLSGERVVCRQLLGDPPSLLQCPPGIDVSRVDTDPPAVQVQGGEGIVCQRVVIPYTAVVTAKTGVKGSSSVFGVGQEVKDKF